MATENRPDYKLEGQGIVVLKDQERGFLRERESTFLGYRIIEQDTLSWVSIDTLESGEGIHLFLDNCDSNLFSTLKTGDRLKKILASSAPLAIDGSHKTAIAAIYCAGGMLYSSPGFNPEKYLQEHPNGQFVKRRKAKGQRKAERKLKREARRRGVILGPSLQSLQST